MPKKDTSFCTEIYIRENCSDRRENAPSIFILYFFGGDNWTVFVSALPQAKHNRKYILNIAMADVSSDDPLYFFTQ